MHKKIIILSSLFLASILTLSSIAYSEDRILNIQYTQLTPFAKKQIDCLAENIYYEAGHESDDGKKAVAFVTLNRMQDQRFPKDICSVVKQKTETTCQFTWYCDGNKTIRSERAYQDAKRIALHVYANYDRLKDITLGALYYHADYVNPRWKLEQTTKIGRHIFYKEKGI